MSSSIELHGVSLDYPLYSVRAKSIRNAVANIAVGGRLLRGSNDVTVVRAIANLSFKLEDGDRLALVGHNGSGKSSLLKVLAGIYEPTSGGLKVNGRISSMLSLSIGLDHEASGLQNIKNLAMMQMMPSKEIARRLPEIIEFSNLGAFIHMPFKTYSAGMMARLTFAVATQMDAEILLMDEWLGAGDADFQAKAAARIDGLVNNARILVLATHDPKLVTRVCNKVLVMDAGRAVFMGSTEEWIARSNAP